MASVMEHKRTCRESISIKYNEKGKNPFSCATKRQGLDGMDNGWKIRWRKEAVECLPDQGLWVFHYRCRREGIRPDVWCTATYKIIAVRQTGYVGAGSATSMEVGIEAIYSKKTGKITAPGGTNRTLFRQYNTRLKKDRWLWVHSARKCCNLQPWKSS